MKRTIFILIILIFSGMAQADLRPNYEDAVVVERSELIAVAHIKEGSIVYVPHQNNQNEGTSWEYHATLVITEVLKGKCDEKEIPIIIHYGLTPVVGGYLQRDNEMVNIRGGKTDYPKGIIEILDTGNSAMNLAPLVKDAREDNIWFLRKRSGIYGEKPGSVYGIVDPEDLQSIELKNYFLAYMDKNPEAAVKEWVKKNPDKQTRAQSYFDHLEVQRILKITDINDRLEKLQPYFLKRQLWDMNSEVRSGIMSCGKVGGDYLMKSFDNPKYKQLRMEIILMWRDMKYKECVPFLIELLKKHNQFWTDQKIENGKWYDPNIGSELLTQRSDNHAETYYGVHTLRSFNDATTRAIIEATRDRWKAITKSAQEQIVEECENALKALSEQK